MWQVAYTLIDICYYTKWKNIRWPNQMGQIKAASQKWVKSHSATHLSWRSLIRVNGEQFEKTSVLLRRLGCPQSRYEGPPRWAEMDAKISVLSVGRQGGDKAEGRGRTQRMERRGKERRGERRRGGRESGTRMLMRVRGEGRKRREENIDLRQEYRRHHRTEEGAFLHCASQCHKCGGGWMKGRRRQQDDH